MFRFERMEINRKYPVPNWMIAAVLVIIVLSVVIHNRIQNSISRQIKITNVEITDYSRVHVEVHYQLTNTSSKPRDIWLLMKVYDAADSVLGSALYGVSIEGGKTRSMVKVIDKLSRPLLDQEKPAFASVGLYKRKAIP